MMDAEYEMMLQSFLEHAKKQDQTALDGAVMIFLPPGGSALDASIFAWVSELADRTPSSVWHDSFVSMLFALIKAGVDMPTLHELVDFAEANADGIVARTVDTELELEPAN
jgi:hypothetical protein